MVLCFPALSPEPNVPTDRASRAVTTLIGADESGRKPRNQLRKALFTAVGMRKSDRGTFMPNVTTLSAVLTLLGLAGVLEEWDLPCPPAHLAPWQPAGPFHACQHYFALVRDWVQGVGHRLRPISDAQVGQVLRFLDADAEVGTEVRTDDGSASAPTEHPPAAPGGPAVHPPANPRAASEPALESPCLSRLTLEPRPEDHAAGPAPTLPSSSSFPASSPGSLLPRL